MSCPQHIWDRAQEEGITLSELGKRGAMKRALLARKRKAMEKARELFTQTELFPHRREH
jgi:hypothetical protein